MKRAASSRQIAFAWSALWVLGNSSVAAELRDPTQPPHNPAAATTAAPNGAVRPARLEAVLHSEGWAVAIIDGKLLRVGDWLGGARIAAISADAVHLTREGRKLTLRLANQAMKVRRTTLSKDPE